MPFSIHRHHALVGLFALGINACAKSPDAPPAKEPAAAPPPSTDPRYLTLPKPTSTPPWTPPAVSKHELSSKATIWHLEQGPLPLVSVQVVLPLGAGTDPTTKAGLTRLTADLLDEGAGKRTALELSDAFGDLATDYSASAGVDYVLLSMNTLSENFDESMGLLADILQQPQLRADEFERRKKHHLAEAQASLSEPQSRMKAGLHQVLFGDGYAGTAVEGTAASLNAITLGDVKARAAELTRAGGAHLVFAGKISRAQISDAMDKYFGSWSGAPVSVTPKMGEPLTAQTAYVVDFPGAAQSALAVTLPAGDAHDPRYFDELVMNEKFGGSFTGRINMNLREDKGYTYGAFAYFKRYEKAGYFAIQSNVVSEKTSESIEEIFKEISELCTTRPLSESEFAEAKDGLLLGYPMEFSQVDSLGMKLASLPIYNRPADYWTTWPANVKSVTLTAARQAASPYCDPSQYRVVLAADLNSVRPKLEKLGLAVVELDRAGQVKGGAAESSDAAPAANATPSSTPTP